MPNGLTTGGRARLRAAAEQPVADGRVPGLVLLVASGGDVQVETAGVLAHESVGALPAVAVTATFATRAPPVPVIVPARIDRRASATVSRSSCRSSGSGTLVSLCRRRSSS